jgi:flagellar biosynthetic protein FliR
MGELAAYSTETFWAFIQVFARVTALFHTAPVFGATQVPRQVKVGLSAIISFVLVPVVKPNLGHTVPSTLYATVAMLAGQVLIGLAIGYLVSLMFDAVRVAGNILDYQMGFTQAALFNPQFGETITPIANFQYQYAIVIYLLANGHWLMIAALQRSFTVLPVAKLVLGTRAVDLFVDATFQMLLTGLEIVAPAAAVLLITDVAFAFLNRAVPQMQVYFVGMPVKIMVGLGVFIVILPFFTAIVSHLVLQQTNSVFGVLAGMHK